MKTKALLVALLLCGCGATVHADELDGWCPQVKLPSSIALCSDTELRALAVERQHAFNEARSRVGESGAPTLLADQNAWVGSYPKACGLASDSPPSLPLSSQIQQCMAKAGRARIAYLKTYGTSPNRVTGALSPPSPERSLTPSTSGVLPGGEVQLRQRNGIYRVPVRINDAITLDFTLDSGASDVQIPADVVMTLFRTETLTENDFKGTATYVLADGSKLPSARFVLRELKVGEHRLLDVGASVGSAAGELLLGQSFLSRFSSWTLDNARHALVLGSVQIPNSYQTPRGRIGVKIQDNPADGPFIAEVETGGSADRAGIRPGDLVLAVDGVAVKSGAELLNRIQTTPIGSEIHLSIRRGGDLNLVGISIERVISDR